MAIKPNSITVKTTPYSDGRIVQEVLSVEGETMRYVIDTREEQIKQALIDLGWTPPKTPPQ